MSKFFKGEKIIVVRNPDNQTRGKTRIGTVVGIEEKLRPVALAKGNSTYWGISTENPQYLYNVQVIENHGGAVPQFTKVLYNLEERDLMHYTEVAEALYC